MDSFTRTILGLGLLLILLTACSGAAPSQTSNHYSGNNSDNNNDHAALFLKSGRQQPSPTPAPGSGFSLRSGGAALGYVAYRYLAGIGVLDPSNHSRIGDIAARSGGESMVLSPDHRRAYLASSMQPFIRAVDLTTGEEVDRYMLPEEFGITGVLFLSRKPLAITPDGQTLWAVGGYGNNSLVKIDLTTHQKTVYMTAGFRPYNIIMAADGQHLYATSYNNGLNTPYDGRRSVGIIDLVTPGPPSQWGNTAPNLQPPVLLNREGDDIEISRDGSTLYLEDATNVYKFSLANPLQPVLQRTITINRSEPNQGFAVSPDNSSLWVFFNRNALSASNFVKVFDTTTGAQTAQLSLGLPMYKMVFTPDGQFAYGLHAFDPYTFVYAQPPLPTTGDGRISVISTATRQRLLAINTPLTPTELIFATDAVTPVPLPVLPQPTPVAAAPSPIPTPPAQSHQILYAASKISVQGTGVYIKIRPFDMQSLEVLDDRIVPTNLTYSYYDQPDLVFAPDASSICISMMCFDPLTGNLQQTFSTTSYPSFPNAQIKAMSPRGEFVYQIAQGSGLAKFDRATNTRLAYSRDHLWAWFYPSMMEVSRDGGRLYVASSIYHFIAVVNANTLVVESKIYFLPKVKNMQVSPDNQLLAVGLDQAVRNAGVDYNVALVNTATLEVQGYLPGVRSVEDMVFSPDGTKIYVANRDPKYVAVLDIASRSLVRRILMSDGPTHLVINPEGNRLFVSTSDPQEASNITVIDLATNFPFAQLTYDYLGGPIETMFVDLHPDPAPVCAADFDGNGGVTQEDLFAFLAAYHDPSGGLRADFNGNGAVTVQDLFDFLAHYNQGC